MTIRSQALLLSAGICWRSPGGQDFRLSSEVRLVVLDVSVRNAAGQPVAGLSREAFRVFDSGREQPLASFSREDAPATVGLVVDASASMRPRYADLIAATQALIEESNPDDEIFLVTFNDRVTGGAPAPPGVLQQTISRTPMEGRTALFDGVAEGLHRLERGTRERKALVVISDGVDNASQIKRKEILRRIQLAHATIYAVGLRSDFDATADSGFLREMAHLSGGEPHLDVPSEDLRAVCQEIARNLRSRYTLAFLAAASLREETRSIRVAVRWPLRDRLKVLVRKSYLALPSREPRP